MPHAELSLSLFTDFYELTMAQAFWHSGRTASATFSLFFRNYPPDRAFFVFAGLADVLDYLEAFRFTVADLDYLRSLGRFDPAFLDHLGALRFTGSVRALTEGTLCFTNEPVLEVTGPVIEAQLIETFLLNQVNVQTLLATKAARVVQAAAGRQVIDFAARRTQGVEAADKLARVSYLVGFDATSNTRAGGRYGIPVSGTMAHSYITAFDSEAEAFRQYAAAFPDSSTFLVDTYDTVEGTRKAAAVAREMQAHGHRLCALRLDSGDLAGLARQARAVLDEAGLPEVQLFASGGLDEFGVDGLVRAGVPFDGFGVGTKVGVSADAPWTDSVYKLVEYDGRPLLKLSTNKQTLPGPKQVHRYRDRQGAFSHDVIARAGEPVKEGEALLREVLRDGRRLAPDPPLANLRKSFRDEFGHLPAHCKALHAPERYDVRISLELDRLREQVARTTRQRELGGEA